MAIKYPRQACIVLLLISTTVGLSACASQPSWVTQPPTNMASACAPAGEHGWQLAELRAKAQLAESQWLTQYQWSQRQQTQDRHDSDWHFQQLQQTRHLQQGAVPPLQQLARWQGRYGNAQLQCVLLSKASD